MERELRDSLQLAHESGRRTRTPQSVWSKFKGELNQAKQNWRSKGRSSGNGHPAKKKLWGKREEPFVVPIRDDVIPDTESPSPIPTPFPPQISPMVSKSRHVHVSHGRRPRKKNLRRKAAPHIARDSLKHITTARDSKRRQRQRPSWTSSSSDESDVETRVSKRKVISFVSPPRIARPFNPSILAIELHGSVPHMTVEWLLSRFLGSRKSGGAYLDVTLMISSDVTGPVLHISASTKRLLEVAEHVGLAKMTKFGTVRRFTRSKQYLFYDVKDPLSEPLSSVEKQRMVVHELMRIRCLETDFLIPGLHNAKIEHGQRIVPECLRIGIITHLFPVHENELRLLTVHQVVGTSKSNISKYIVPTYASQVDAARMYLGEGIAFYLALLRYVAFFLAFPAILGLALLAASGTVIFVAFRSISWLVVLPAAILLVAWAAILLYVWRRISDHLCMHWGCESTVLLLEDFLKPKKHRMSALRRKAPPPRTKVNSRMLIKVYVVSVPLTILLLCFFFLLLTIIWPGFKCIDDPETHSDQEAQKVDGQSNVKEVAVRTARQSELSDVRCFGPAVAVSVLCWIFGRLYVILAYALTDWENHHSLRHFQNYVVAKIALFTGVINFGPLYYLLLIHDDLEATWVLLVTLITTHVVFNLLQETIFFAAKECVRRLWHEMPDYLVPSETYLNQHNFHETPLDAASFAILIRNYPLERSYLKERNMPSYGQCDEINDYTELFIILTFVSSFLLLMPLVGLLALLYCWLKLVIKTHKLGSRHQRPLARAATDIGPWKVVMEVTTFASLAANCLILSRSSKLRDALGSQLTDAEWIAIFLVIQHGLFILLVVMVHYSPRCPDLPIESESSEWKSSSELALRTSDSFDRSSESTVTSVVEPERPHSPPFPPSPPPSTPVRVSRATTPYPSPEDDQHEFLETTQQSTNRRASSLTARKRHMDLLSGAMAETGDDVTDDDARSSSSEGRKESRSDSFLSSSDGGGPITTGRAKMADTVRRPISKSETFIRKEDSTQELPK